jgi:hypothetical protein
MAGVEDDGDGRGRGLSRQNGRGTRKQRAMVMRDCALGLLRRIGRWQATTQFKVMFCQVGSIEILRRTPFQPPPKLSVEQMYMRALLHEEGNLAYGLDIWHEHKKVMNLEWESSTRFI